MKTSIYIISAFLILLIGLQNIGERYGSYAIFSWFWLILSLSPIIYRVSQKKEFSRKHIFLMIFLITVVLIQPITKIHPILILASSLVPIIPFLIFELKEVNNHVPCQSTNLSEEIKSKCKKFIAANRLEKCFEILSIEPLDKKTQKNIIALKQKWNQNKREKNMSLNTNEWLEVQNSKIIDELLELLK